MHPKKQRGNANAMPLILMGLLLVGVAALGWYSISGDEPDRARPANSITTEEVKRADGDTFEETVNSLRAETNSVLDRSDLTQRRLEESEKQRKKDAEEYKKALEEAENKRREIEASLADKIKTEVDGSQAAMEAQFTALMEKLQTLEASTRSMASRAAENAGEVVESATITTEDLAESLVPQYQGGEVIDPMAHMKIVSYESLDDLASGDTAYGNTESMMGNLVPGNGLATGGLLGAGPGPGNDETSVSNGLGYNPNVRSSRQAYVQSQNTQAVEIIQAKAPENEPYFTLPHLSEGYDATALTALVGKVYFDDDIQNPYPFKVVMGRNNMSANFQELPEEINGMKFGGYAYGDRALGCVVANITSASFVFNDGTVRPAYLGDPGSKPDNEAYAKDQMGYLSDERGNPCVPGTFSTDAPKVLGIGALLAGAQGYASALRQEQIDTSVYSGSSGPTVVESVTGSASKFALANAYTSGIENTTDYLSQYYNKPFGVVYVPPGERVVVNLEQELRLDIPPDARKIRYSRSSSEYGTLD